jgi:hypothetical protein
MMALTHHVMVGIAARRAGMVGFTDYALLGDDLVIANEAVARSYQILAQDLGVEINLSKSLVSTCGVAEFAKRLFDRGKDLSPLPPKLIASLLWGKRNLPDVLRDMSERGLSAQTIGILQDKGLKVSLI